MERERGWDRTGDFLVEEETEECERVAEGWADILSAICFEADGGIEAASLRVDVGSHEVVLVQISNELQVA